MKNIIAAILLSILSFNAFGGELNIIMASKHTNPKTEFGFEFNETNPGISYRFDNGVEVGVYKNSFYRTSTYAGYNYKLYENSYVRAEVMAVAVTGYGHKYSTNDERHYTSGEYYASGKDVMFGAVAEVEIKLNNKAGIEFGFAPNANHITHAATPVYDALITSKLVLKF